VVREDISKKVLFKVELHMIKARVHKEGVRIGKTPKKIS
jgi:hypothetical protein